MHFAYCMHTSAIGLRAVACSVAVPSLYVKVLEICAFIFIEEVMFRVLWKLYNKRRRKVSDIDERTTKCLCSVQRVIKQTNSIGAEHCLFVFTRCGQYSIPLSLAVMAGWRFFKQQIFYFKLKQFLPPNPNSPKYTNQPAHDFALMHRDKKSQNALFLRAFFLI